ncbi:MAG: hypothetical protein OXC31_11835 [Spirochaetaceae bacterium]|nr:hypothetical protein [Spirochaetaceae bacterium]
MPEQRTVWVKPDDVDAPIAEGRIVRSTRPLDDWCLRRHDRSEPIPQSAALEIIETRPFAAMARELPPQGDMLDAALDLQAERLFEVGTIDDAGAHS